VLNKNKKIVEEETPGEEKKQEEFKDFQS